MRLYLDTNTVLYMLERRARINNSINALLLDYSNTLYTSSACVQEMIFLRQRGKVLTGKSWESRFKKTGIVDMVDELGITILPVKKDHLRKLEELPIVGEHRDHNDRVIIAQAISDKATLVSSDSEFGSYEEFGLDFIYNER